MEVRYLAHAKQLTALELIPQIAAEFEQRFGRDSGGLVRGYRLDDAETIVVALGSVLGTLKDTVDELRAEGLKIGVLGIQSFRPVPAGRGARGAAGRQARGGAGEELLGRPGRRRLHRRAAGAVGPAAAGLHGGGRAGRARHHAGLAARACCSRRIADKLPPLTFLDLDWRIVNRQLEREAQMRRSGPIAENLLRDVGTVASKVS